MTEREGDSVCSVDKSWIRTEFVRTVELLSKTSEEQLNSFPHGAHVTREMVSDFLRFRDVMSQHLQSELSSAAIMALDQIDAKIGEILSTPRYDTFDDKQLRDDLRWEEVRRYVLVSLPTITSGIKSSL